MRQVDHVALPAPAHQHLRELVELGRAQDPRRDRPGQHGPLLRQLGRAVSAGVLVGADDGHQHQPAHPRLDAFLLQIPGRREEELRGRPLFGRRAGGRVDDDLHAFERRRQSFPGDHVDAVRAGDRHHVVPALVEHVDNMPSHSSGRPRYRDPCHVTSPSACIVTSLTDRGEPNVTGWRVRVRRRRGPRRVRRPGWRPSAGPRTGTAARPGRGRSRPAGRGRPPSC